MNAWNRLLNWRPVSLLTTTNREFGAGHGGMMAAAVSFHLLFSIFPFALAMISLVGFVLESPKLENQVINAVANLIPVARELIIKTLHGVISARAATGVLAVLGFIWSASAFFGALRNALNAAWDTRKSSSFVANKLIALSMTLGAFILVIIYIWLSTVVRLMHMANLQSDLFEFINGTALSRTVFGILSSLLGFVVILFLFKFIPAARPRWRDIWLGALCAAAGFEIVRVAFVWYVKNFGAYNLVYGPVGAVIALLMFIYVTSWVLLFFARFCAIKSRPGTPA